MNLCLQSDGKINLRTPSTAPVWLAALFAAVIEKFSANVRLDPAPGKNFSLYFGAGPIFV